MKTLPILLIGLLALAGCGPREPEHVEKPFSSVPPPTVDLSKLRTPEEKIRYIEDSKAPKEAKEQAIAQVRAGKL